MPRPSTTVFTAAVANAAGDCFEIGRPSGGWPAPLTSNRHRLRPRCTAVAGPDAPEALRRMSALYDARQAEEARLRLLRDRMRGRLARAAGHD